MFVLSNITVTKWLISTQHVQCVLLYLVLVGKSARLHILQSYTLLLKSPVLMRYCSLHIQWNRYNRHQAIEASSMSNDANIM